MKTLTIRWEHVPNDPPHVLYFVDDAPVGQDDEGLDKILDRVRAHKTIRVILKIQRNPSRGGHALRDTLPFKARLDELEKALGENKLVYEFE